MPAYVSNKWPFLKIGSRVAFESGLFETDDPEVIALIERNEAWLIHIHPRDGAPAPPLAAASEASDIEESLPRPRSGRRGSR
jgi:hypothetical protein